MVAEQSVSGAAAEAVSGAAAEQAGSGAAAEQAVSGAATKQAVSGAATEQAVTAAAANITDLSNQPMEVDDSDDKHRIVHQSQLPVPLQSAAFRQLVIVRELLGYNADIFCLQVSQLT